MAFGQNMNPCCRPPVPVCPPAPVCPPPVPVCPPPQPVCVPVCCCVERICCDPCLGPRRVTQCFQTMVRVR
ncbi:unnamed protein product [Adineta ricciae]|uniref:Uncharacterized protein n=1 Tax=Adineta ricciae TaxID=249248 RepID=A0A816DP52_ADIRI|nr:unnamed protein product [Adineta ricciae]CAF1637168.1 unnamed protein product [Adineta ricciae]